METENRYTGLDQDISTIIRRKARQLVGQAGFTSSDIPDLEQELFVVIFENIHRIDTNKGSKNAFLRCLVERHAGKLVKSRQVQCRDWRLFVSLPDDMDSLSYAESGSAFGAVERRMETEKLIELLPDELAELAKWCDAGCLDIPADNSLPDRHGAENSFTDGRHLRKCGLFVHRHCKMAVYNCLWSCLAGSG